MRQRFYKHKYFYNMLIKFLLPVLLSITVVGGVGTAVGYSYLKAELDQTNQKLLQSTLYSTELMLSELDSLMLAFDINPGIINKCYHVLNTESLGYREHQDLTTIETFINAPVNARQYIDSIYIYYPNPYNRFIRSNNRGGMLGIGIDEGWLESYQVHKDKDKTWSERRRLGTTGRDLITVYQMMDYDGVVILNLDARYMKELLDSAKVFSNQSVFICSQNGDVLLQTGPVSLEEAHGKDSVVYSMDSERYQWSYQSAIPKIEFYRLPLLIVRYTFVCILLVTFLGILLAYAATRLSYRNFETLQELMEAAREGKDIHEYEVKESSDYFAYITRQMIQNFIEQDFLKVQLSERKYKLRATELLAMQSQMNPHFLYNTLETVNWKIMEQTGKRTAANDMLEDLSEILVYSLDEREQATMEQEIHVTECYIKILKERYGELFLVEWSYEEDVLAIPVVKFVLQPLLENAVNHGIREKEGGTGRIRIKIFVKEEKLHIHVVDNGAGIEKEKLTHLRNGLEEGRLGDSHIGIFNTNKRLQLAYGESCQMKITSRKGEGTVVMLVIPMSKNEVETAKNDTFSLN